MLTELNLYNFTLIEHLTIPFSAGMTAITGESGAGKSIIMQALELCLGKRSEQRMVGLFSEKAQLSATFDCTTYPSITQWLTEQDYATTPLGLCVIRRVIDAEGHSKAYLNDRPCTNQTLKTFGSMVVNFHGQHENQALLTRDHQRTILDHYANLSAATLELKTIVQQYRALEKQRLTLQASIANTSGLALLQYQLEELLALNLQPTELTELEQTHQLLGKADTIAQDCQEALQQLADGEPSLLQSLSQILHLLQAYHTQPAISQVLTCAQDAIIQLNEAEHLLRAHLNTIQHDPDTLAKIEQRLMQIHDMARKHRVPAHSLYEHMQSLQQQCQANQSQQTTLTQLQAAMDQLAGQYQALATTISQKRQTAATQLSEKITKKIKQLGLSDCFFKIALYPQDQALASHGLESVAFLVGYQQQPTEAYPLHKVASGGELSRISLAIQAHTAQHHLMPSLVFDEIDVGLSGGTTEIVGQQLRSLGELSQVLCITHLPQVAALAHQHLKVEKQYTSGAPAIQVTQLTEQRRVQEIARMLGGLKITEQTLIHAEEILNKNNMATATGSSHIAS